MKYIRLSHKQLYFLFSIFLAFSIGFILRGQSVQHVETNSPSYPSGEYRVSYVLDGDTIELEDGTRVRLEGIDAPERGMRFSEQSRELATTLMDDKTVFLEVDDEVYDQYGRVLGYIWIDDMLVNEALIEEGYATVYRFQGKVDTKYADRLLAAERRAQSSHRGLWVEEWDE